MEPHRVNGPRAYVSRTADQHEIRISFVDGCMQHACHLTVAEAADVRDMLSQALGPSAQRLDANTELMRELRLLKVDGK
jgi:hypothetical protein